AAHPDAGTRPRTAQDQNTGDMIEHQAPIGNSGRVNHANRARSKVQPDLTTAPRDTAAKPSMM
ncbi:hypothetical protein, partial [Nocardia abscessus]|uniref:hypothetical protein n=1 Tax=Nocardia abscessus TaxID=120957 RepID=UPI001E336839